jgi:FKBP-type peptidyl-prolyl cis-trans isomerase
MPVGSSWILYIHPDLAYGANPRQGSPIGANEMLTFEIELLSIDKK